MLARRKLGRRRAGLQSLNGRMAGWWEKRHIQGNKRPALKVSWRPGYGEVLLRPSERATGQAIFWVLSTKQQSQLAGRGIAWLELWGGWEQSEMRLSGFPMRWHLRVLSFYLDKNFAVFTIAKEIEPWLIFQNLPGDFIVLSWFWQ